MLLDAHVSSPSVEVVEDIDGLASLQNDWATLWQSDANATVFQRPEWLIPWARRFTSGAFNTVAVRRHGDLAALLPSFTWSNPQTEQRELILLGTGVSDYTGILHRDPDALRCAIATIGERDDWDTLNFESMHPECATAFHGRAERQDVCPTLDLEQTAADWPASVPAAQLQNFSYYLRRAERVGRIQFERADEESAPAFLEDLFALHSARWRSLNQRGALADEQVQAFHFDAAPALARAGLLRLYRLRIRDDVAAVFYGFAAHHSTCYYLGGFDPRFASVSPGTLLIGHSIREAMAEGHRQFDFLRGSEKYKYLWGARDTYTCCVRMTREQFSD